MSVPVELTRELERLGARYGQAVVREEAKRLLKGTRGNKPKSDLVRLRAVFEADALDVLEGRDPTKIRTNYSVAREFAARFPDKAVALESTVKRVERKLRKNRLKFAARGAFWIAEEKYPFSTCIKIYDEYVKHKPISEKYLKIVLEQINEYRDLLGEPPEEMTIGEIRENLKRRTPQQSGNFLAVLRGLSGQ
ncbi:hypothetical protein [Novosphingobium sp.]|uniref:hypothetical protein n=1 Tax=Novosphingobium sp. TaxID=1874826 RepID=UPI0038B868DB